jgi:HEAT repeat protein
MRDDTDDRRSVIGPLTVRNQRRRLAALAGHRGDAETARALTSDDDPGVRATALAALDRAGALDGATLQAGLADPSPAVRRRAALLAARHPGTSLLGALADEAAEVVEAAAWASGERAASPEVVAALAAVASDHGDALCREAAVAALGALGAPEGLGAILAALEDKPAVRRRAVLALAPYEGPEVDAALERMLSDRDWQVRQAAEDLR